MFTRFPEELLNVGHIKQDVREFLDEIEICKVLVSQVEKTWEIYFTKKTDFSEAVLKDSESFLTKAFKKVKGISLIPTTSCEIFNHLDKAKKMINLLLEKEVPSINGCLKDMKVEFHEAENTLKVSLASEWAVSHLYKKNMENFLKDKLKIILERDLSVKFLYDKELDDSGAELLKEKFYPNVAVSIENKKTQKAGKSNSRPVAGGVILGKKITLPKRSIIEIKEEERNIVFDGMVFDINYRELKTGRAIFSMSLTDLTSSIVCKMIRKKEDIESFIDEIKVGEQYRVKGTVQYDQYAQEHVLLVNDINKSVKFERQDTEEQKRIELHLHTTMSKNDAMNPAEDLIKQAAKWGHEAIAITDHGVVQAFPDAFFAGEKHGIKILYGMEAYVFNDGEYRDKKQRKNYHFIVLVKNRVGLKNLFTLISESNLQYYKKVPRIPMHRLAEMREGLIFGSACEAGELITKYMEGHKDEELEELAKFYDFLEIQPAGNNEFMIRNDIVKGWDDLYDINKKVFSIGKKLDIPVVATGDVHFLNPEDEFFRRIIQAGQGFGDANNQPPLYFKTTQEMLEEFSYLGKEEAFEVVVTNPKAIADQIERIRPIPDQLYPPEIPEAEKEVERLTYETAHKLYGENLPEIVQKRIDKELGSIISNGFSVLYYIAHKLVKKSNSDGYLVGSRGSVGSSLVATLTGITEVNPLAPHYRCEKCFYSEFIEDGTYGAGVDMPDKNCPDCGEVLVKDGFEIPFEVFLGFKGDKVPDIDLNFSGDYQACAHKYVEELFGSSHVFKAGTIATIADKTAYGYVKNYLDENNLPYNSAEISRLVKGCTGIKRTTGQHPGGMIVVPKSKDVYDFTPLQHPAEDVKSTTITTHFDFHSLHDYLVKLDILGHDDPTVIRMLEDLTGLDALKIPLDDQKTMSLFSSTEALGVTKEDLKSNVASYGIPEFGTKFVRQMLEDTLPKTFSDLVRISGFSHGTDVWLNNAQDLIKNHVCQTSEAISARDDIMTYLLLKGLEPSIAFKIMEDVRKGKGVKEEYVEEMKKNDVPQWYIDSCNKIKYMFPKAHAVAYVTMAFRIAYFKINYPLEFYATFFTVRADEFDVEIMSGGVKSIEKALAEITAKGLAATNKEKGLLTSLELALEMCLRGFRFQKVSIEKSLGKKFIIEGDSLIPPFIAVEGLGESAALNVEAERAKHGFRTVEDLQIRGKLSKTVIETMRIQGCFENLPETNQITLFE